MRHPASLTDRKILEEIIRVNHAGESGAKRIYEGQLDALKDSEVQPVLEHMYKQELTHLKAFDTLMQENHVRPTVLSPLWHTAAYALGWLSGKLGKKAAMAVTIAVEEAIDAHYQEQETLLKERKAYPELQEKIHTFRLEELEHRDHAIHHEGQQAPMYSMLYCGVRAATKMAIALSKKI